MAKRVKQHIQAGALTLQAWVDSGRNMLSHITVWMCCRDIGAPERTLREMKVADIVKLPTGGEIAAREMRRFDPEMFDSVVNA